jgi:hypothetical protein
MIPDNFLIGESVPPANMTLPFPFKKNEVNSHGEQSASGYESAAMARSPYRPARWM